uniref:Ig-like domain-containing protein n=1 Tax=Astyanax mexicanus TaxID=7994 RepID=A0A8B9JFG0_ASTMX
MGTCRPIQEISADLRSVSPGEIITLHCSISADYEIYWYHQNSEQQMKLLVFAARRKINKSFSLSFNINTDHYEISENSSSVSLVIIGINDTDLGLYYCGGRNKSSFLQFGKPIKLTFTGKCSVAYQKAVGVSYSSLQHEGKVLCNSDLLMINDLRIYLVHLQKCKYC